MSLSVYRREILLGREEKSSISSRRFHGGHCSYTPPNLDEPRCTFVHPLPSNVVLVWCMAWICMRPSLAGWDSPENLQFSGLREGVLGEYVVRLRVRTYAGRELRVFGMHPASVIGMLG